MDASMENATIVVQNDLQRFCVLLQINYNCTLLAENILLSWLIWLFEWC